MRNIFIFCLITNFLASCAATKSTAFKKTDLSFAAVESLMKVEAYEKDLVALFGPPEKVLKSSPKEELWLYFSENSGELIQKAAFIISTESKTILTASWIPYSSDTLHKKDAALKYSTGEEQCHCGQRH